MSTTAPSAPSPNSVLFARGVLARLAIWPALRIAVEQSWGGPESAEKRTWLASVLVDAFEQEDPAPDVDYVELTLLQVMEDEFDTTLEDGSTQSVANDVVQMWEAICAGRQDAVTRIEDQAEKLKGKRMQAKEVIADEDDLEDESSSGEEGDGDVHEEKPDGEAPMLIERQSNRRHEEPQVDEDGFTVVKGKGRNHR